MLAKKIPQDHQTKGKRLDVAKAYGLTLDEFNQAYQDFVLNEGFNDDGFEVDTLHDWLTKDHKKINVSTAYQKADDINDMSGYTGIINMDDLNTIK